MFLSLFSFLSSLSPTSSSLSSIIFLISFAMVENLSLAFYYFLFSLILLLSSSPQTQIFYSLFYGGDGCYGCCYDGFCWLIVGMMVMDFVAGCGCGGDGFCVQLWV